MEKRKQSKSNCGFYSFPDLTDANYQKIADALHVPELIGKIRNDLQNAIRSYFADKDSQDIPRSSQTKTDLLKIKKASELLLECSPTSIDLIRPKLMPELKIRSSIDNYEGCDDFFNEEFFHRLYLVTMEKLEQLEKDKGGRYPDSALHIFIGNLAGIYEDTTGKKPGMPYKKDAVIYDEETEQYIDCETKKVLDEKTAEERYEEKLYCGPFFRFTLTLFKIIDPIIDPPFKATLFSTIRSTLKNLS